MIGLVAQYLNCKLDDWEDRINGYTDIRMEWLISLRKSKTIQLSLELVNLIVSSRPTKTVLPPGYHYHHHRPSDDYAPASFYSPHFAVMRVSERGPTSASEPYPWPSCSTMPLKRPTVRVRRCSGNEHMRIVSEWHVKISYNFPRPPPHEYGRGEMLEGGGGHACMHAEDDRPTDRRR